MRRFAPGWLTLGLLSLCGAVLVISPQSPMTPAASRTQVTELAVPLDSAARADSYSFRLAPTRTAGFNLIGVTWSPGRAPASIQIRVHRASGWTHWRTLHPDAEEGESRPGTEATWIGRATGVAVRATGPARGLRAVLVDPGQDPVGPPELVKMADGTPTYTPMPAMISRAGWGARANKPCDSPRYGSHLSGVIFHHTAGSNRYAASASRRIVRAIQAYHMSGRGWCDIGYNFLVDKHGQVFEGRSGGVLPQVRGAHAGNYDVNTFATGVAMMGNLDVARPTEAMKSAAVKLIGWRLGTNYLPALGTYPIAGKALPRIAGHRQVRQSGISPSTATACPGRYGYAWLRDGLRARVAAYIANYSTPNSRRAAELGSVITGPVRVGEYPSAGGYKVVMGNGTLYAKAASYWVSGPILTAYIGYGEETGALGYPTADALTSGDLTTQQFENGTLTFDSSTGLVTRGP